MQISLFAYSWIFIIIPKLEVFLSNIEVQSLWSNVCFFLKVLIILYKSKLSF
jgi:hypothetical protein